MLLCNDSIARYTSVKITGMSSVVDIEDILNRDTEGYTDTDIKRICAEITDRYHRKGYTAFYVRKAELNQNGTVELFVNESIVKEISVTGVNGKTESIASLIYNKGDVFNEFILRENISNTRKKYGLKYIKVSVHRTDDDQILLKVKAAERSGEINFSIISSPVYGVLPELGYTINYGMFHAGLAMTSSFDQKETSYTRGAAFIKRDISTDRSWFIILSDYSRSEDSFDSSGKLIYKHNSLTSGAGFGLSYSAMKFNFLMAGTYDILRNYPGIDCGASFCGIEAKFSYNDSALRIDYEDVIYCGIDFFSGWNFIEKAPVCRFSGEYKINAPLFPSIFISFNGNFFYTSDNERFLQWYVFDQNFPCKNNDFTYSSWKNTTGTDLVFETLKRIIYIGPCFMWGLYNTDVEIHNVYAAGMKGLFLSENVKIELSFLFDVNSTIGDGYFFISATGHL